MDSFIELFMVSPTVLVVLFLWPFWRDLLIHWRAAAGLLTVPALMAAGLPPAQALATNKLQACGGIAFGFALFYPPQGGESGRSEAQYSDDLYRLNRRCAAGPARPVRYS
jgi:hypothetical protein